MGCLFNVFQFVTVSMSLDRKKAMKIHNAIMRKIAAKYLGYEVKVEGDAFMIAFGVAMDALRFCVEVQISLLKGLSSSYSV